MIEYHVIPKTPLALEAVARHGAVMALAEQRSTDVLLVCATKTCACGTAPQRWRRWFRLGHDVVLRPRAVPIPVVTAELASAESIA